MKIIPAIDLLDGKVVRLFQGKKERVTVYSKDPLAVARQWKQGGADLLHIVDLSASFGEGDNLDLIEKIAASGIAVEVGGGIRSMERADRLIGSNVSRIILGTKASDPDFLSSLIKKYRDKVAVSVDAYEGKVATHGWQKTSQTDYLDFIRMLAKQNVKYIVYTDISKDGTLQGPSIRHMKSFAELPGVNFILSGGIGSINDLKLVQKDLPFLYGIIVGKALYDKTVDLAQAIAILEKK